MSSADISGKHANPATDSVALDDHGHQVGEMFDQIATRYDLMNLVMTWGQELRLIRETVDAVRLPEEPVVLDVATGTGDLALEVQRRRYGAEIIGLDLAADMMEIAKQRPGGESVTWVQADALELPFEDNTFDAVTHGYLMRNVSDLQRALDEQFRVLKPGGWMAALEMSPAPRNLIKPFSSAYITWVVPKMANMLTGTPDAYEYLSRTSRAFSTPAQIEHKLSVAGFVNIGHSLRMFGTMAIHWAQKPAA